jgi:hypothetical protein
MRFAAFLSVLGLAVGCAAAGLAGATAPAQPEVYLKMPGRGIYTGPVINGIAEARFSNGDSYQGEWKNGKPDGVGTMTYMLGGSYAGEWKDGQRDGKGVMTFAGSGRHAEVRFADDRRVDVAAAPALTPPTSTTYWLVSDEEPVGSHIRNKVAFSPLPLDQGFDELTPDQQRFVRAYYPALDAGDEPPYPQTGGKELVKLLVSMERRLELKDDILVYVAVDADAQVTSVSTISSMLPRYKDLIATAAGLLKYKPARCGGRPCPGVVPFNLSMDVNHLQ